MFITRISIEKSSKPWSSKYRKKNNANGPLKPRSGLDSGMSFSFSSFGNEDVNTFSQNSKPRRTVHEFNSNAANAGDVTKYSSSFLGIKLRNKGVWW